MQLMFWSIRIAASRLRPWSAASIVRSAIVLALIAAFLCGDFILFQRLFRAVEQVETMTPLLALGLLRNLLGLVFLIATAVLFSSALTTSIGAFFTDLDLDLQHSAPIAKWRIVVARWLKALLQSGAIVFLFLIPILVAFARQFRAPFSFYPMAIVHLALLLTIPVSIAACVIVALVRWFPVQRVHQIVATVAILALTVVVIGFRMARPERLFTSVTTDDAVSVLRQLDVPSMEHYPGTALADAMIASVSRDGSPPLFLPRIVAPAVLLFALFFLFARRAYFAAFVRARESLAPAAVGAAGTTRVLERLIAPLDPPLRALIGKEVRTLTREVAQWSQLFLMLALLFIYLYNIRMLPLGGDARATLVAYANLGMTGFIIAAVCLRFAYPSIAAEGKAFWMLQSAPLSYRSLLRVKVAVYALPLTIVSLLLTVFANVLLDANGVVWTFTLIGASLLAVTLVSLGVALGALAPDFTIENPLQVGLSLGGFAYMAASLAYVAGVMLLMARPLMRYFLRVSLHIENDASIMSAMLPVVIAITVSWLLAVVPLRIAERRLIALGSR
jgi:ABC-2 type transport system permease protein